MSRSTDWEAGGLLLTAWSQVRIALAACVPEDFATRPIMRRALSAAYVALDDARLKANEEESMSWSGSHTWNCEDTSEDPRGDPPEPVRDDWPEPDYLALAIDIARKHAAGVADPVTAAELRESLGVAD